MNFTSSDIAVITGGVLTGPSGLVVEELVTDSRQVSYAGNSAFVAIKGINHDGHSYIDALYSKGVRVFIVEHLPENYANYTDTAFIETEGSIYALQHLAAAKRAAFKSTVIAVTGSNGKTIVKEWLADVLGREFPVVRSPKSFNSQVGVPLSVWKLDDKFKFGIFEAGISFPEEMANLQKVINPDIGIITNIGEAHGENFPDIQIKAREKLKLFTDASVIIYCSDHCVISELIQNDIHLREKKLFDWSFHNQSAKVFVRNIISSGGKTKLEVIFNNSVHNFEIPFTDRASIENSVTVATACMAIGLNVKAIKEGLANLVSVAMRMEMKSGINNCQLIEDYYNSDPDSLNIAIDYLRSQSCRKTTLVLSDFVQSGREEKRLYNEVADLVRKTGINKFIGIGPALMRNSSLFDDEAIFFYSTEDFISNFNSLEFSNEIILLKGARVYELERIGKLLEQKVHITVLEINLDAILHNLNQFRLHLDQGTRIMAMVKAFAYGSGPAEIARFLEYHGISYLGVAYTDEGIELRKAGINLPVMIMNPDISSADAIIQNHLEPEIYSFASLERFAESAARHGLYDYPVHLKIDTGMHRLGFMPDEVERAALRIKSLPCLKVMSVFSHLAASENPAFDSFTRHQADLFLIAVKTIKDIIGYSFLRHILNTAGIFRFPEYQLDMVRPGIGIYGAEAFKDIDLKPVGSFKTRILQIKKIPAGEPVGYGCADSSDIERTIAILPVGYADGLNRKSGNRNGNLFIKGRKVPLIGNICMDMCMADISGSGASEGDEAEIFGKNIPIWELAGQCSTIPYEILTSIPGRVKRVFFRE